MADSIAGASDEQARGIQEINRAVTQLDQVTQVNAAASEEAAAASEELSAQAQNMRVVVAELARIVNGSQAQIPTMEFSAPARPAPAETKPKTAGKTKTKTAPVIHLGSPSKKTKAAPMSGRMASGGTEIPSEHDERFRDI